MNYKLLNQFGTYHITKDHISIAKILIEYGYDAVLMSHSEEMYELLQKLSSSGSSLDVLGYIEQVDKLLVKIQEGLDIHE